MNEDNSLSSAYNRGYYSKSALAAAQSVAAMYSNIVPIQTLESINEIRNIIFDSLKDQLSLNLELTKLYNTDSIRALQKTMSVYLKQSMIMKNLDIDEAISSFESFIEYDAVDSKENKKPNGFQINTKNKIDVSVKEEKIEILKLASVNLEFSIDKFKKVLHKSYSYASERKVVVWSVSSAFGFYIGYAAQLHPFLPLWICSVTATFGLLMPKDK